MTDISPTAVLFDLDGTLLDTIEDLAGSMNATLADRGLPTVPTARHKLMVGKGARAYVLQALPDDRRFDEAFVQAFQTDFRADYAENWSNRTHAYDGVPTMLDDLSQTGLALAVLSNKPERFTRLMVDHFFGDGIFRIVRGAREDVPLKPDPTAALAIAEVLGVAPARFLYLGDTATDMRTARSAGMIAVGALWGFRDRDELVAAGAQHLIKHPGELLALI